MTEDEAKTKWCPFARIAAGANGRIALHHPAYNRFAETGDAAGSPAGACIVSACMAWRWSVEPIPPLKAIDREATIAGKPGEGFCGLAGAPS